MFNFSQIEINCFIIVFCRRPKTWELLELLFLLDFLFDLCIINFNHRAVPIFFLPTLPTYMYLCLPSYIIAADPGAGIGLVRLRNDFNSSSLDFSDWFREYLNRIWPRLEIWYKWFNTTQTGPIPGTFR